MATATAATADDNHDDGPTKQSIFREFLCALNMRKCNENIYEYEVDEVTRRHTASDEKKKKTSQQFEN